MHTFTLNFTTKAMREKLWLALTDPKYTTQWDGNRWAQNDACLGGTMRARNEEGLLFEAEILRYDVGEKLVTLVPVPKNPEEPEEGSFPVRLEFALEPLHDKTILHMKATGFPDESSAAMMKNSWGGFYLEKIGKVAEAVSDTDAAALNKPTASGNDFPGHVRHTELATLLK